MVAFIGMGLLGSNFTKAMLKRNEQVAVWNRTTAKAQALEAFGAVVKQDVADAVRGAVRVHITLKDDAAVNSVLQQAEPGLAKGTIIVDHTTTSVDGAKERTEYWKHKGMTYVHAPVFMGPANALESTGFMLVSGDQEIIESIMTVLEKMTGKVINFGEENGRAAAIKLMGNLFLIAMTAGVADMLAVAKANDVPTSDIQQLFGAWNPAGMLPARLAKMTSNTFHQPTWELDMARKDARLMMEEAGKRNKTLIVVPAVAKVMDELIGQGLGNNDWTVIGKNAVE